MKVYYWSIALDCSAKNGPQDVILVLLGIASFDYGLASLGKKLFDNTYLKRSN